MRTFPNLRMRALEAGEADVGSHVAMARHQHHAVRYAEAAALLDSVTCLSPVSRDAGLPFAIPATPGPAC